jgi:hypothetical protein
MIKRFFLGLVFILILGGFFLFKYNLVEIKNTSPASNNLAVATTSPEKVLATTSAPVASSSAEIEKSIIEAQKAVLEIQKNIEENILARTTALARADQVKGVYVNGYVGSSQNSAVFKNIKNLLSETELNAIVIDVKESDGPYLPNSMRKIIADLHKDNIWVVARVCAFRDSSLIKEKPEWYLKYNSTSTATSSELWRDASGGYWLDPANLAVQDYLIEFSKKVIDFGFDELQFDYIRFPSDGNTKEIIYDKEESKFEIMGGFFTRLSQALKIYSYKTILSADLFGYVATQYQSSEIGQRIADLKDNFDYISFMLYPSHFYGGFNVPADAKRELPAVYFPYSTSTNATDTALLVSANPYQVVLRSIFSALDFLEKNGASSTVKIRPWLQDFNLKPDTDRGIYYDAAKVKAQIQAAEDAGASGWLLWNASGIYNKDALLPK